MREIVALLLLVLSAPPAPPPNVAPAQRQPAVGPPQLVALNVPDLEASVAWYRDNLGFVQKNRKEFPQVGVRIAMLELGGFWLEIVEKKDSVSPPSIQEKLPAIDDWDRVQGIKKLAFEVDDLDAFANRLRSRGVRFYTGVIGDANDPVFGRSVIVVDASGNWIQLCELDRR